MISTPLLTDVAKETKGTCPFQISSISYHFVLWEAVSQTKYCCSHKVKRFASQKFWAGFATASSKPFFRLALLRDHLAIFLSRKRAMRSNTRDQTAWFLHLCVLAMGLVAQLHREVERMQLIAACQGSNGLCWVPEISSALLIGSGTSLTLKQHVLVRSSRVSGKPVWMSTWPTAANEEMRFRVWCLWPVALTCGIVSSCLVGATVQRDTPQVVLRSYLLASCFGQRSAGAFFGFASLVSFHFPPMPDHDEGWTWPHRNTTGHARIKTHRTETQRILRN